MKFKIVILSLGLLLAARGACAQWVVSDPTNLAQGIVNSTKQVVEAAKNGQTMLQSFQETVKIYEQGRKYYDALKSVSNLVRSARKVQQCILWSVKSRTSTSTVIAAWSATRTSRPRSSQPSPQATPASSRSRPGN